MRNTLEYPVTKQEVIDYLVRLQEQLINEGAVGDMRPIYISIALDAVKEHHVAKGIA
jgi:hypothetical protein